jgi:single-stranded DNA-binding protein
MNQTGTVTLIGYLGRPVESRDTATRTVTVERANVIAESTDTYEYETQSREYGVFSVATHTGHGDTRTTAWNRCVAWNLDRMEHRALRLAKSGERVEVTGRWELYTFQDQHGQDVTLRQLAVTGFRVLGHKPAPAGDPDEPFVLPRRRTATA